MVASAEAILDHSRHRPGRTAGILPAHRRRGFSISSVASVINQSSSMSSESRIWNTLTHKELAEVSGGPTSTTDQQFGKSDDLLPVKPIPRHRDLGSCLDVDHRSLAIGSNARNRNYDPSLGRWINQDPLQYINGADTYQFVMGNPVGRVDPSGLSIGPLQSHVGQPHELSCHDNVCSFYVDTHYSQDMGELITSGGQNGTLNTITHDLDQLTGLSGAGTALNAMFSSLTINGAEFAWHVAVYYVKRRTFTYTCGTHFADPSYQSTKVLNYHADVEEDNSVDNGVNNFVYPGMKEAVDRNYNSSLDLISEIIHDLHGD